MVPCSGCHRHVLVSKHAADSTCPFCGTTLRDVPAPLAFAGLLLGLSLMGCGDGKNGNEEGAETTDPTVTASSSESESSGASGTLSTTQNQETAEASDYGGPETTDWDEETGPLPEESSSDDSTGQDSTGTDTGTTGDESSGSDTTGTDTGNMMTDASGEGSDYGGAPPPDQPL